MRSATVPPPDPDEQRAASVMGLRGRWTWLLAVLPLLPVLGLGAFNDDYEGMFHLSRRGWQWVLDELHPTNGVFRPLSFAFARIELDTLGTRHVWPFHLVHLALWVLAAAFAGKLASRWLGRAAFGWGAALALVYPARLETAAWLSDIFGLLALVLVVVTLVLVTSERSGRRWQARTCVAAMCLLAPLAKESAYALPVIVVAWELLGLLPAASPCGRLLRCGAAVGGAVASMILRLIALGGIGGYAVAPLGRAWVVAWYLPEMVLRLLLMPANPTYGWWSVGANTLCVAAGTLALVVGLRTSWRVVAGGLAAAIAGLGTTLPYLDPATLTWNHSRYTAVAGIGIVLVVAAANGAGGWRHSLRALVLVSWLSALAVNMTPWLEAARARDTIVRTIAEIAQGPGPHSVWVGGPILRYRGVQFLGGRLGDAVRQAVPSCNISVDSEFQQDADRRPVGPPQADTATFVFTFDPWTRQLRRGWRPSSPSDWPPGCA